jgi:hypothetical protein
MLEWGPKESGVVPILLDGEQVATAAPDRWREGAELVVGGDIWTFARDGRDRVARLARSPRTVLRASKKSVWRSGWVVTGDGVSYEIVPKGLWVTTYYVLRDGLPVGAGRTPGFWSARPTLDLDQSVPPVHQLFLLWITHIMRQRQASAAAAGS